MTINVQLLDLPVSVKEAVTINEDDSYTIFLNARHSAETQRESYDHAMEHILADDFRCEESVQEIEYRVHKKTKDRP